MATKTLFFDIFARDHNTGQTFKGIGASVSGLTSTFAKLGVAIAGAFAVERVVEFGKATVEAFAEAEKSQARLEDAFTRFPALSDTNIASLRKLNEEIQSKTGVDHNQLAAAQANIAAYGLTGAQLKKITPLIADYAVKTGQDAPTAALALGKALLGNTRALKTIGINFKATGDRATDVATIITALQDKVGGFAENQGKTFAGQLQILSATFQDLKEKVGSVFAPALGDLVTLMNEHVVPAFDSLVDTVGPKVKRFLDTGARGLGEFVDAIANAGREGSLKPISDFFDKLSQKVPAFAILKTLTDTLGPIMPQLSQGFLTLGTALTQQGVLDALTQLVTDVLPPLVTLLVALTPLVPPIASALTTVLVPALQLVSEYVTGLEAVFSGNTESMKSWLRNLLAISGPLGDFFRGVAGAELDFMNGFVQAVNGIAKAVAGFVNSFSALTHIHVSVPSVPSLTLGDLTGAKRNGGGGGGIGLAEGGVITARPGGVQATIGEGRHDEAVIPLSDSVLSKLGGGGGVTVHVSGFVGNEDFLAKTINRVVVNARKRGQVRGQFA